ncbi:MFS transporter [Cognatiyoonia sp. IB215182]|uniref:MFS transporter n=1 Tax=Cognatiyoonia sp. IB215182 TaxID=3097353 RepID=UPI002A0F128A|nr:MFS transporter [Cognatiyoonia sp. IB215182]MDX8351204.1 MFS transporter [Cognatiyoonia sp. IB215182]
MALSMGQKAGWGLADAGIVVFVIVKQLLIVSYLTTYLGIPVAIAGFVTTIVLIFDMITDPLIGYFSDRTQSRFGRRAPWMFAGAIVMALGMVGLFMAPVEAAMGAKLTWVIAAFGMATIGFTMCAIPYGAQAGEITQNPRERSTMTGWRMAFATVGILVGGAVLPGLAGAFGFPIAALYVTPLMIGAIWLSLWSTRNAPRIETAAKTGFVAAYRLVFSNRTFVVLALGYGVMTLAVALITAGLPFAAAYLVVDDGQNALSGAAEALTVLSVLFGAFFVGAILSQVFWVLISHRLGKLWALVIGLSGYVALLYGLSGILPSTNVTLVAGVFVIAGITNGAYQQIPWAMYPDLMDVTREESGIAIEGAFSAVWLFGQKLANAIAPALLGLILARAGWQETTEGFVAQINAALEALQLAITLIPAGILVVAVFVLLMVYRPMAVRALA